MRSISLANPACRRWTSFCIASLLLVAVPGILHTQTASPAAPAQSAATGSASATTPVMDAKQAQAAPAKPVRNSDRRKAAKLYLAASKQFVGEQFEEAIHSYEQAAALDPGNTDYPLAASVARSHAVTALIQAAAKDRMRGETEAARAALAHALELEPTNSQVKQHLYELGDDALLGQARPIYEQGAGRAGDTVELAPSADVHSFHLHADQRQIIQQVFKSYGIEATVDESIRNAQVRLDVDDARFETAARLAGMVTNSFFVPLDAHRVLVLHDSNENRRQYTRQEYETVYLSGLTKEELTDIGNLAKNVFNAQQAVTEPSSGTITLRAPQNTLDAFNATMSQLLDGHSQVLLEVRLIQLAHISARKTGVQPPQSVSAINVYSEEQSILNANQALVQQIISSGLAAPGDTLAILGILLASGQVYQFPVLQRHCPLWRRCHAVGLSPGPSSANLNLNSSDSRELDQMQLRLGDGEDGTLTNGVRYPIQTSSFSSIASSGPSIPGLHRRGKLQ